MNVIISALFILFSSTNVFGQLEKSKLQISHLTGDFYVYTTYNSYKGNLIPANGMYVVTENGVVLFDTPWDTTQFQPLVDSIRMKYNKNVVVCIATHFHEDRTGGLEYYRLQGIKTYTTSLTDSFCKARGEKRAEYVMNKDTVFKVGQYTFQTYYGGQGHTPDNIVIWFDKEKILYGGCAVKDYKARDLGNLADANVEAWATTINNVRHKFKNPRFIIIGHDDWTSKKSLTHTLRLIKKTSQNNSIRKTAAVN